MDQNALAWQVGVWNGISEIYVREIDRRFAPVVDAVMTRAGLTPGERVLDLGTGTGAVAERAAEVVGPGGYVVGVDISAPMLALARAFNSSLRPAPVFSERDAVRHWSSRSGVTT